MQHAGTRVIYIPGNHDATFRKLIGKVLGGVEIRMRDIYTTRRNQRLLITHGDELDSNVAANRWLRYFGGWAYDRLMKANTLIIQVRDRLGMPYWSLATQIKSRVSRAVEYVESFESGMITLAKHAGVDGVVCGHIHKPAMKTVDGIIYCNDGDWVESCSALVEHNTGELELVLWHESQAHLAEEETNRRAA
jgi:UDP-2,3-diacylglucosamine pyrophosphatase LpxH